MLWRCLMASFDVLVNQFIRDRKLDAAAVQYMDDGRLKLSSETAQAICGVVRLLDPAQRVALVEAAQGFDSATTEAVLGGLHADAEWGMGMLEHLPSEAALTLLIAAKLGVIEG